MTTNRMLATLAVLMVGALASTTALAGVSAEEAAKLKGPLTPVGAERAGNKDGSIPAWDGGYAKVDPGYKPGDPRPSPFSKEKPLYSVTAATMSKHVDALSDGVKALLTKYPKFRLDVYPTHRTAAFPDWVLANTAKNALSAQTTNNGLSVTNASGGVPFPIPKDGYEAIWNHMLTWRGESVQERMRTYVVSGGTPVLASESIQDLQFPYYSRSNPSGSSPVDFLWLRVANTAPPFKAGEAIVGRDPLDMHDKGRQAWQYLTGQRRVRKAPSIAYDTPDFVTSGVGNFDEVFVFWGQLDRYDWTLVGKQEMLIPYNNNDFTTAKINDVLGADFLNPDHVRWERHRVWVVEAKLAPGKRHVVTKRRLYLDEDTWLATLVDQWDAQGQLWKLVFGLNYLVPDLPGIVARPFGQYNLLTGAYLVNNMPNEMDVQYKPVPVRPESHFTPAALAGEGVR